MYQRLVVFKNLINAIKADLVCVNIAQHYELKISPQLLITAYSEQDVVIHYIGHKDKTMFLRLEEMGLAHAFYDFLSTVHKSNLVKSKEETLQLMEALYAKYAK